MKKNLALAILSLAAGAQAQTGITLTSVLDTATSNAGSVYAAAYSVADNKYLASSAGTAIRIYNGDTGAYESNLNISTVSPAPAGLGFFGLAAGSDGSIFGYENGEADATHKLYQWDNVTDATATETTAGVPFTRLGHVLGTGNSTKVVLTGDANSGPIHIFTTTDDVTYTETETVPAAAAQAKGAMAVNSDVTETWGVGDTGTASVIKKAVKTGGTWAADPTFVAPAGTSPAATLVYDNANNVLFAYKGKIIYAFHGDSGEELGQATVTNGINGTPGYAGGYVSSTQGAGTVWFAGRGTVTSDVVLQKLTYTVPTAAQDWAIYE